MRDFDEKTCSALCFLILPTRNLPSVYMIQRKLFTWHSKPNDLFLDGAFFVKALLLTTYIPVTGILFEGGIALIIVKMPSYIS